MGQKNPKRNTKTNIVIATIRYDRNDRNDTNESLDVNEPCVKPIMY